MTMNSTGTYVEDLMSMRAPVGRLQQGSCMMWYDRHEHPQPPACCVHITLGLPPCSWWYLMTRAVMQYLKRIVMKLLATIRGRAPFVDKVWLCCATTNGCRILAKATKAEEDTA